jgi:hypothetical protein
MGWPTSKFPTSFNEVDAHYERVFPRVLSNGGPSDKGHVDVRSVDRTFRERLASISVTEWSAFLPLLGLESPEMNERLNALFEPLRRLAVGARDRDDDLWLFGRA